MDSTDALYLKVELLERTTAIVCAFVSHNAIPAGTLPDLIGATFAAVESVVREPVAALDTPVRPVPAVAVEGSVTPDRIVSLIDGKPYQALKRHLAGHGYTPATYREAYGLPADYPMTAANYSLRRAELAKQVGLGTPANRQGKTAPAQQAA